MTIQLKDDQELYEVPLAFLSNSTKQVLEYDLFTAEGMKLLGQGQPISDTLLARIKTGRVTAYKIGPKKKEQTTPAIISNEKLEELSNDTSSIFNEIRYSGVLNRESFSLPRKHFTSMIKEVDSQTLKVGKLVLAGEMKKLNGFVFQHAVNTGTLAMVYGIQMRIPHEQLLDLVQAAFIFDVGLTRVPDEILNKEGRLTNRERQVLDAHTRLGYHLINEYSRNNPEDMSAINAKLTSLLHHQKFNGKGYPSGNILENMEIKIPYKAIPQLTKITGICDMYAALEAPRPYRDPMPAQKILRMIVNESNQSFDVKLVHSFINHMGLALNNRRPFYHKGDLVLLSTESYLTSGAGATNEIAVVEEVNTGILLSPTVRLLYDVNKQRRLKNVRIDLRNDTSRRITRFIDSPALIAKFQHLI